MERSGATFYFTSATLPRGCVYPLLSSHFPRLQGLPPMPPHFEKLQKFCYNIYIRNTEIVMNI